MHVEGKHEAVIIDSSDHVAFSVFHYSHQTFGLLVNGLKIHTFLILPWICLAFYLLN